AGNLKVFLAGRFDNTVEQVPNHLVAHGGDSDLLAGSYQLADHPRAGVRLSRPRRALEGQDTLVEVSRETASRHHGVFLLTLESSVALCWRVQSRTASKQQVSGCAVRARG